jgi:hypothetical protein
MHATFLTYFCLFTCNLFRSFPFLLVPTTPRYSHSDKIFPQVLKIGSASLSTADGKFLNLSTICALVETIISLRREGHSVVLVTSVRYRFLIFNIFCLFGKALFHQIISYYSCVPSLAGCSVDWLPAHEFG